MLSHQTKTGAKALQCRNSISAAANESIISPSLNAFARAATSFCGLFCLLLTETKAPPPTLFAIHDKRIRRRASVRFHFYFGSRPCHADIWTKHRLHRSYHFRTSLQRHRPKRPCLLLVHRHPTFLVDECAFCLHCARSEYELFLLAFLYFSNTVSRFVADDRSYRIEAL